MQTKAQPGARLARLQARDPAFWTPTQRRAFELASELAGVPATKAGAESWKQQRGAAFAAWRTVSRSRRKAMPRATEAATTETATTTSEERRP